jgi:hypothetical protein
VQCSGISEVRIKNAVTQDLKNQEEVCAEDEAEQGHPLPDPYTTLPGKSFQQLVRNLLSSINGV